jgi:hypothetical protein
MSEPVARLDGEKGLFPYKRTLIVTLEVKASRHNYILTALITTIWGLTLPLSYFFEMLAASLG